jgi:hypothetical protein
MFAVVSTARRKVSTIRLVSEAVKFPLLLLLQESTVVKVAVVGDLDVAAAAGVVSSLLSLSDR